MSITSKKTSRPQLRYHPHAYQFVFAALRFTQEKLGRGGADDPEDEDAHITGQELLDGIRQLGLNQFGLMTRLVFGTWGIQSTNDFGRIVFELVERGEMRKTDRDQLVDFADIYDFEEVFDTNYVIDTSRAFCN